MLNDLRLGMRGLARNKGFAAAAIVTLALGIGANTAIFSVVNAVLLRALPYHDPSSLVLVHEMSPDDTNTSPTSAANFDDWKSQSKSFDGMAAAETWIGILAGNDRPEQVPAIRASANLFEILGVQPALGRTFAPGEDEPGKNHVLVLSHKLWQNQFGGDPGVVGRNVKLNAEPYTVIGVMPAGFEFPTFWATNTQFWAPLPLRDRMTNRQGRSLRVFARLAPGVTLDQARAEMSSIAARLAAAYPAENTRIGAGVRPLRELTTRNIKPMLLILMSTVGMLLLIACANVANLLLARSAGRRREIGVRLAVGASRVRLVRLLLAESLVIAFAGGMLGIAVAAWGIPLLAAMLERASTFTVPRASMISVDTTVLAFTTLVSIAAGLIFGLVPAMRASRVDLNEALKDAARGSASGSRGRLRNALVIAEVALSLMLLAGAGLLLRSFLRLTGVEPGFNPRKVLTMTVPYAGSPLGAPERRADLYREITRRVSSLPGVESASAINHIPIGGDDWHMGFVPEGQTFRAGEMPRGLYRVIRPNYFHTMQIPILHGRDITEQDDGSAPHVAVITEATARQFWGTSDAVGKRFRSEPGEPWMTVVGVSGNVVQTDLKLRPAAEYYVPHLQAGMYTGPNAIPAAFFSLALVVRTKGDPMGMLEPIRREIRGIDPGLALSDVATMDAVLSNSLWQPRLSMALIAAFAGLAVLLACVGVYGVVAYAVSQRTREFGVRTALGASPADLLRIVVRDGAALAATGIVIGTIGAVALSRGLSSLLFNTAPTDPVTFLGAAALLAAVVVGASLIPARRAMNVQPVTALRHE